MFQCWIIMLKIVHFIGVTNKTIENAQKIDTINEQLVLKADKNEIPTKVSELENDANYLTEHQDISDCVKYKEFDRNDEKRKTIQLENYDNISGIDTKGTGHNLVMLSKWDVADFGAPGLHANINTKDNFTINDKEVVATESVVDTKIAEATEGVVKHQIDSKGKTIIVLANDEQILSRANMEELEEKIEIEDGSAPLIKLNKWNVVDLGTPKTIVNINTPKNERPTVQEQGQSGAEAHKIAYLDDLNNVIKKEDVKGKKAIVLENGELILGRTTTNRREALISMNPWDVIDLGSTAYPINLNTPKGVRPTVQEAGVSGPNAEKIAYLSDIDAIPVDRIPTLFVFPYIMSASGRIFDVDTICGWFGISTDVEDKPDALRKLLSKDTLIMMRYTLTSSNKQMYYTIPIEFAQMANNNIITLVACGLNHNGSDEPSRIEVNINLDGALIEGHTSNVKVTILPLANRNQINDLQNKVSDLENRLAALETKN